MKYKITLEIECDSSEHDHPDIPDAADIIGGTAMDGAKKYLDPKRNPKPVSCVVEYTGKRKVRV